MISGLCLTQIRLYIWASEYWFSSFIALICPVFPACLAKFTLRPTPVPIGSKRNTVLPEQSCFVFVFLWFLQRESVHVVGENCGTSATRFGWPYWKCHVSVVVYCIREIPFHLPFSSNKKLLKLVRSCDLYPDKSPRSRISTKCMQWSPLCLPWHDSQNSPFNGCSYNVGTKMLVLYHAILRYHFT